MDDIRKISDEYAADGNAKSRAGLSNMVWGFGQFLGAFCPETRKKVKQVAAARM